MRATARRLGGYSCLLRGSPGVKPILINLDSIAALPTNQNGHVKRVQISIIPKFAESSNLSRTLFGLLGVGTRFILARFHLAICGEGQKDTCPSSRSDPVEG